MTCKTNEGMNDDMNGWKNNGNEKQQEGKVDAHEGKWNEK